MVYCCCYAHIMQRHGEAGLVYDHRSENKKYQKRKPVFSQRSRFVYFTPQHNVKRIDFLGNLDGKQKFPQPGSQKYRDKSAKKNKQNHPQAVHEIFLSGKIKDEKN